MSVYLIILFILYLIFLGIILVTLVLENGRPTKTIAWILFVIFVPIIGLVLYSFFGKNYRRNKLFTLKKTKDHEIYEALIDDYFDDFDDHPLLDQASVRKKRRLIKLLLKNSKAILSAGNKVEILNDGKATFESIFAALREAKHYIHIQYYILEEGTLVDELVKILLLKIKEGVKVRIIYDAVGSWNLSRGFIAKLQQASIQIYPFMPVHFGKYANKINYRNHRKIIVVDGTVGFTGGINISDKYLFGDKKLRSWRDTHLRIEGPAVRSLQMVFLSDWYFVSREYLFQKKDFFPKDKKGGSLVQIVTSGPDSDYSSIKQEYFSLITNAEHYIYILTPYFVPGENIMFSLKTAALSGVDVRIILPDHSDSDLLKWCTRSYVEELLTTGVKFYFYKKGFMHSKVLVSDDIVASVGTANMDERSFDSNFEVNAIVYDEKICQALKSQFLLDQKDCEPILYRAYKMRPKIEKLKESVAKLLSPLL